MKNKRMVVLTTIVIILSVIILSVMFARDVPLYKASKNTQAIGVCLKASLHKKEKVIGAVPDGTRMYAITSKTGRSDYGDTFVVFDREKDGSWKRIYENDFKELKPWRIELADLDGDQVKEIVTAVHKTTHFDKTEKNRLFVFNYTDGKLVKKWTGSQIAGDWEDYSVGDFAPTQGDEVVFIRHTPSGERISIYYWYHFGFLLLMESDDYKDITKITHISNNRIKIMYQQARHQHTVILVARDKKLIQRNDES